MAEMQKMTKDEALAKVAQGVGSIYSKEDVVNLINSIMIVETASITSDLKSIIADAVAAEICCDNGSLIDDFECDVMMTGYGDNRFEVELNNVELDESRVAEIVLEVLDANLDTEEEGPTHFEVEIEEDMETE
jgi:hypothetical protein